ncbi:MAG: DUF6132 family protein [Chthoniobacterales bacterium]
MKQLSHFAIFPYLPVVIGALLGALLGYFGQCASGTCPLTSTWWRGALYGAVLGTLFFLSARSDTATGEPSATTTASDANSPASSIPNP